MRMLNNAIEKYLSHTCCLLLVQRIGRAMESAHITQSARGNDPTEQGPPCMMCLRRFWKKMDQRGQVPLYPNNWVFSWQRPLFPEVRAHSVIGEITTCVFPNSHKWHTNTLVRHAPAPRVSGYSALCLMSWMKREIGFAVTRQRCLSL